MIRLFFKNISLSHQEHACLKNKNKPENIIGSMQRLKTYKDTRINYL
jgi:hypothetical protein